MQTITRHQIATALKVSFSVTSNMAQRYFSEYFSVTFNSVCTHTAKLTHSYYASSNIDKKYVINKLTMKAIAAKEAKNNFGEMLDTVQREPLTIEKHGRAVAVIMSAQEYQQMKLERLQARPATGEGPLDRGTGWRAKLFLPNC